MEYKRLSIYEISVIISNSRDIYIFSFGCIDYFFL